MWSMRSRRERRMGKGASRRAGAWRVRRPGLFSILLIQGGIERHVRIVTIVVTHRTHDVRPDTCRILVEYRFGICRNGKPGACLHFRFQLPRAPSGISDIGAKGFAPGTGSQNAIDKLRIPTETDSVED